MKEESQFVAGQRVRRSNSSAPNYSTPANFPKTDTKLDGMNVNDLKGLRHQVEEGIGKGIVADSEVRTYLRFLDSIESTLENKNIAIAARARQAAASPSVISHRTADNHEGLSQRFSITKAIANASLGKQQDGAEAEIISEGQKANPMARGISLPSFLLEQRNIYGVDAASPSITAAVTGQRTVSSQLLASLQDAPVAAQLGATMVQASGAHFLVPWLGSMIPASANEGASLSSSASFSQLDLQPQRYGRRADITALALRAASPEMDTIIMRSMAEGHATAKDRAAFAAVVANATYQLATAHSTNGLANTDLADMFNLAKSASTASGNSAAPNFVCSPIGFQALNTAADSTINQTMSGAYRNATGAQVLQSNTLLDGDLTSADVVGGTGTIAGAGVAIAGNWQDLFVAEWGVDLVLDNITDADKGAIRCISNSYIAAGVVRDSLRVMGVTSTNIAAT